MKVLKELKRQGYFFWLEGGLIQYEYRGNERPDPAIVRPMLEELRQRKGEAVNYLQAREEELRRKVIPFPYPINETMGIGDCDPLDFRYIDGKAVLDPGWWKRLGEDNNKQK